VQGHERYDYLPRDRAEATYRLPMRKIAVSQWLVDLMRERYGDATSILVPNAVDHGVFNAAPRDKQAAPTVGMMYSEPRWKGCDISLHAVSVARQDILDLQLLAFGHGLSAALPLPAGAVFSAQPTAGQIRATYSQCDVWLFGAREEGFGLPILEAMACRTPVIGTPVGAAPELLADGAGILVSREDPHAMARAIVEVCRMENAAWRRLSDAAYARASQYSWDKASAKFEGALMEIAAGG